MGKPVTATKHDKGEHTSPRVPVPRGTPLPGTWIWTCREDATADLMDELGRALPRGRARVLEPGLVASEGAPTHGDGQLDVTFARQGFRLTKELPHASPREAQLDAIVAAAGPLAKLELHVWAPDTDAGNRRMPECTQLAEALAPDLTTRLGPDRVRAGGAIVHLVAREEGWLVGVAEDAHVLSPFVGGRSRMRIEKDKPSRAARKVEEALHWFGVAPGAGEVCVDLGAAPGGWSWVLLEKRARVIAVDPAELRPDVARHRSMRHEKRSAFQYEPDEPVDWLFCDMAWRPLEAAQLLAKWGRRRWARMLVANLKLPMKQKAALVEELRAIVHGGGWGRIRTRQLYHDRDEITLLAVL